MSWNQPEGRARESVPGQLLLAFRLFSKLRASWLQSPIRHSDYTNHSI